MNDACFLTRNYDVAVGHTNNTKIRILPIDARRKFIVLLNLPTGKRYVLPRIRVYGVGTGGLARCGNAAAIVELELEIELLNKSCG